MRYHTLRSVLTGREREGERKRGRGREGGREGGTEREEGGRGRGREEEGGREGGRREERGISAWHTYMYVHYKQIEVRDRDATSKRNVHWLNL